MACKWCIGKQQKLVKYLCKKPDSRFCLKAKQRLERMLNPPIEKRK